MPAYVIIPVVMDIPLLCQCLCCCQNAEAPASQVTQCQLDSHPSRFSWTDRQTSADGCLLAPCYNFETIYCILYNALIQKQNIWSCVYDSVLAKQADVAGTVKVLVLNSTRPSWQHSGRTASTKPQHWISPNTQILGCSELAGERSRCASTLAAIMQMP